MPTEATLRRWIDRLPPWASERLGRLVGSDFVQKVSETFLTRIGLIALGLLTSVMVARVLGPEGRGLQAAIATVTALGIQFGNAGLHSSNTYYVARSRSLMPTLVGNSLAVSLGLGGLLALLAGAAFYSFPSMSPLPSGLMALALAGIPIGLGYLLVQNLLLGIQEVREYNRIELLTRVLLVASLAGLIAFGDVTVVTVATLYLAISVVSLVWAYLGVSRHSASRPHVSVSVLRQHLGYGFKAYIAALFAYTVLRADVLMATYLLGAEPTGQYSIAVSMADLVYMMPVVAGTIAFPRLAATDDPSERRSKALSIAKWIAVILVAFALVAGVLARPAVLLLYGEAFLPSVGAFLWLLPGIVLLGVNTILMNYFAAEGMPPVAIWSPAVASVANLALNFWLMPQFGIVGASIASTLAYGLMLVFSIGFIAQRHSEGTETVTAE